MVSYSRVSNLFNLDLERSDVEAFFICREGGQFEYPPARLFLSQADHTLNGEGAFNKPISRLQDEVYVAVLKDAIILPNGFVLDSKGRIVVESIYPWSINDVNTNHQKWIDRIDGGLDGVEFDYVDECVHLRSPAEPGYFHWVQTTMPRICLVRNFVGKEVGLAVPTSHEFMQEFIDLTLPGSKLLGVNKALKVGRLYFPSTMQQRGDHFHRPLYANIVLRDFAENLFPDIKSDKIIYISRSDAKIRKLRQEREIEDVIRSVGGEIVTLTGLSATEQIRLFRSAKLVVSPHGAGLVNTAFMSPGASVFEFLSPQRLWPTFKCIADRVGLNYFGCVGVSYDSGQTDVVGVGNEDFDINVLAVRDVIKAVSCL